MGKGKGNGICKERCVRGAMAVARTDSLPVLVQGPCPGASGKSPEGQKALAEPRKKRQKQSEPAAP